MSNDFMDFDSATQSWLAESARVEQALYAHYQREREYEYRRESNCTWLIAIGAGLIAALLIWGGF
jgi:hypothetical protein